MFFRSLQAKFILPVSILVMATTLAIITAIAIDNSRSIEQAAQRESLENLSHIGRILAVTDSIMMERVRGSMKLLIARGSDMGTPRQGGPVLVEDRKVRDLIFGNQPQAHRFGLVDGVTATHGGTATLFSRAEAEFVRISTNVSRDDGKRAIGTRLDPGGKAIKAIMGGQAFYGQVDILGNPFLTGYEPMHDRAGGIVGVWYVGYKVDMRALQESIAESRILHNGFIALLDDKGKVRFHSDNVRSDVVAGVASGHAEDWVITRETFAPWQFEIVAAYPKSEVRAAVEKTVLAVVVSGLLLCGILMGLLFWLAHSLVIVPLKGAVAAAGEIAHGDLSRAIDTQRNDEIGILLKALNHMRESLIEKIDKISSSTISIDKLEAAQQHLLKLDQMKSDFLSSVSHELRTPLTSIRGFASLVEREFSRSFASLAAQDAGLEKKSQRIRDNLAIVLKESERLTRLINDVLDLAKIEAGRIEWHDARVDPEQLVRNAADVTHGMFGLKPEVALHLDIQPGLPPCIGDADKLLQVLVNLLNNATKFTDRGTVTIKALLNARNMLQIEIHDTGIGFLPEEAEAIFDKFQQAKHGDTLADRPKGTGLGLAISREIVVRHGGQIWAQSQPGVGSMFAFTLPLASGAALANIAGPFASVPGAGEQFEDAAVEATSVHDTGKILVVDDDPGVRDYLSQLLREAGYDVISAADGQSALVAAKAQRPDLITMDLAMPVMDGYSAIVNLRTDPALQHIPIMVVSAVPGLEKAGGDLAIDKPIDEHRFLDSARLLLNREAEPSTRAVHFLVLHDANQAPEAMPYAVPRCNVEYCPLDVLPERLQGGFRGMVVVPTSLLGKVDLGRLQTIPCLEIMIMPQQAGQSNMPSPSLSTDLL